MYWQYNQQPSFSLSCVENNWGLLEKVRYNVLTKKAWKHREFIARPLLNPWQGKLRPILAISPSRLVVAAGRTLYVYRFHHSQKDRAPGVRFEFSATVELTSQKHDGRHDITDITFLHSDSTDCTLYAGFADGTVGSIVLPSYDWVELEDRFQLDGLENLPISQRLYTVNDVVQSVTISGNSLLSVSSTGIVCLNNLESQGQPITMQLRKKTWSALVSLLSSSPYAAFGTSSATPLALYSITESCIHTKPYTILEGPSLEYSNQRRKTSLAVFDIRRPPASFPTSSDQVLISGW